MARRGFTLIELMVVLAVLALILIVAVPNLSTAVPGIEIKGAARDVATGLRWARSQAITGNREESRPPDAERWNGPYLKKREMPLDPWGNPFVYRFPGEHGEYDLLTLGADEHEGGEGEDQDVVSW